MDENNTFGTIAFWCLIIFAGVLFYNMAEISAYNPVVVGGGLVFLFLWGFHVSWGDWFASIIRAPPEFVTLSGIGGRKVSGPEPLPGGKMKCRVAFNRSVLPKHLKKGQVGGLMGFFGMVSGTIVLDVVGDRAQFKEVDRNDCENENGCVLFRGRIDGAELHDPDVMGGLAELQRLSDLHAATVTSMKVYGQQLATLINQRHLDDDYTYNRAKMIADNMKNVKIISKGAGGGAVEAVAGEL